MSVRACQDDLSIHPKKLADVENWFSEAFNPLNPKLAKYRRVLVLSGPAGAGKTAVVRMLAKEKDAEVIEWKEGHSGRYANDDTGTFGRHPGQDCAVTCCPRNSKLMRFECRHALCQQTANRSYTASRRSWLERGWRPRSTLVRTLRNRPPRLPLRPNRKSPSSRRLRAP